VAYRKALQWYYRPGVRVIDAGAHQESSLAFGEINLTEGFGVELRWFTRNESRQGLRITPGFIPAGAGLRAKLGRQLRCSPCLEHIPDEPTFRYWPMLHDLLAKGGRVIITVPSKAVDPVFGNSESDWVCDGHFVGEHYGCSAT